MLKFVSKMEQLLCTQIVEVAEKIEKSKSFDLDSFGYKTLKFSWERNANNKKKSGFVQRYRGNSSKKPMMTPVVPKTLKRPVSVPNVLSSANENSMYRDDFDMQPDEFTLDPKMNEILENYNKRHTKHQHSKKVSHVSESLTKQLNSKQLFDRTKREKEEYERQRLAKLKKYGQPIELVDKNGEKYEYDYHGRIVPAGASTPYNKKIIEPPPLSYTSPVHPPARVFTGSLIAKTNQYLENRLENEAKRNIVAVSWKPITHSSTTYQMDSKKDEVPLPMDVCIMWPEYSRLQCNDVIVTIEYCCDCSDHCITLRHDEKQYLNLAKEFESLLESLLSKYAIRFGIVLHPYSEWVENPDKLPSGLINNVNVSKRMGAFEVQIAVKTSEVFEVQMLHSKIFRGSFPSASKLLSLCKHYLEVRLGVDEIEGGGKSLCLGNADSADIFKSDGRQGKRITCRKSSISQNSNRQRSFTSYFKTFQALTKKTSIDMKKLNRRPSHSPPLRTSQLGSMRSTANPNSSFLSRQNCPSTTGGTCVSPIPEVDPVFNQKILSPSELILEHSASDDSSTDSASVSSVQSKHRNNTKKPNIPTNLSMSPIKENDSKNVSPVHARNLSSSSTNRIEASNITESTCVASTHLMDMIEPNTKQAGETALRASNESTDDPKSDPKLTPEIFNSVDHNKGRDDCSTTKSNPKSSATLVTNQKESTRSLVSGDDEEKDQFDVSGEGGLQISRRGDYTLTDSVSSAVSVDSQSHSPSPKKSSSTTLRKTLKRSSTMDLLGDDFLEKSVDDGGYDLDFEESSELDAFADRLNSITAAAHQH